MGKNIKLLTVMNLVFAALYGGTLRAEKFVLTKVPSSLGDWKSPSFYLDGKAPTGIESDEISLAEGLEVEVDGSSDEVISFLESICRITFEGEAVFALDVSGELEFNGRIFHATGTNEGRFEKRGAGHLRLKSTGESDYRVDFFVMEGSVTLPEYKQETNSYIYFDRVWIEKGATIYPMTGKSIWQPKGISGGGDIVNESDTATTIYLTHSYGYLGPYSGKISGKITIQIRTGRFEPTCQESDYSGVTTIVTKKGEGDQGLLVLDTLGSNSDATTATGPGSNATEIGAGSRLLYTGLGETSDRPFAVTSAGGSIIDGGTNGALRLTGLIKQWGSTKSTIGIVLQGESLYPCTFAGQFADYTKDDVCYTAYFTKRGSGEWYFPDNRNLNSSGVFAVEDGILSFDSITRRFVRCSLGTSSRLTLPVKTPTEADKVDYAFLLGGDSDSQCGMMSCTNEQAMLCFDRPFGLKGKGGFLANAGLVKYAGVFGVGEGAKTLVLDGSSLRTNEVHDIADGDGTVSMVKRGAGTWLLGGDLGFSGSISVEGGTLIVRRPPSAYSQYRLQIMECSDKSPYLTGMSGNKTAVNVLELCLYDESGKRRNLNLKATERYAELKPGECCWGWGVSNSSGLPALERVFDGLRRVGSGDSTIWHAVTGEIYGMNSGFYSGGAASLSPSFSDPASWVCIDMYLEEDAPAIHHFDLATSYSNASNRDRIPTAFQLLGSADGVHWEEMSEVVRLTSLPEDEYYWLSSFTHTGEDLTLNRSLGWVVTNSSPMRVFSQLENVSSVKVSGGARFVYEGDAAFAPELDRLKVSATDGGGTVDGFAFAENGEIEVESVAAASGVVALPVSVRNVAGGVDFSAWNVTLNGNHTALKRLSVDSRGNLVLNPYGTTIIVR